MAVREAHPSPEELTAFSLGMISDEASAALEAHLSTCSACQEQAGAVPGDNLVDLLRSARTRMRGPADAAQTQTPAPRSAKEATVSQVPGRSAAALSGSNDDTPVDLAPPELAGHDRYRLVRLLGVGGMGAVYEAEHRVMQRRVALKVIKRDLTLSVAVVARFRREVRAAARLTHPHVVTTYDAEDAGASLFLVMEYVEGVSLSQLVKERGPLPMTEACAYVRQAALGLQHAHEHGMVHRDVKPANLIRCADGTVKVLDFGLATLTTQPEDGLTEENAVMGTPNYMAPEQAENARQADIRADVYSLGCTLYQLLTGDVPYPTGTTVQKILAHREQAVPSVRAARPDIPAQLAAVVTRMLAKKPGARYQTPAEVAAVLEPFTKPAEVPLPRKRRLVLSLLAAAALLAGVVVYRIQTDRGVLEITTERDDVEVLVKQGGKLVEIMDAKTKKRITLRSGVYDLELKGAPKGLKLDLEKAVLTRDGTVLAKIERLPHPAAPLAVDPLLPLTPPQPKVTEIQLLHRVPIPGRWDYFTSTAVSNDGKLFAADVKDGKGHFVVVWDGKTGKELYRLAGWYGHLTPDGKKLFLFVYGDNVWFPHTCRIHDAATGKQLRSLTFPATLWGCWLVPDSRHAFIWTEGKIMHLCDLESTKILQSWLWETNPHHGPYTDDGRIVFVKPVGQSNYIAWDVQKNQPSSELAHLVKYAHVGGILPGNRQAIAAGPEAGKSLLVDVADGKWAPFPDRTLPPHQLSAAALLDFRISLLADGNGRYCTCDYMTGKETAAIQLPKGEKFDRGAPIALSPNGGYACVETNKAVYLLRLAGPGAEAKTPLTPPQPVVTEIQLQHRLPIPGRWDYFTSTAVTSDGKFFAADVMEGKDPKTKAVAVWDGKSGKELYRIAGWYCQITVDGKRLVCTDDIHALHVHDLASGKELRVLQFNAWFYGYTLLPDSRHARVWTKGDLTHICDLDSGKIVRTWQNAAFGTVTSDDGRILFVKPAGESNNIAWDVQKDQPSAEFAHIVKYAAFPGLLPGNKQAIVAGAETGKYLIVDVADGKSAPFPERTWPPHARDAGALLDMRIRLLEDGNGRYCTFDFLTGKEAAAIQLPKGEKFGRGDPIALAPKGGYACVETNKAVYLLRLVSPQPAVKEPEPQPAVNQIQALHRVPLAQRGTYCAAAVAPDGKLFSASWIGGSIVVWDGRSGNELYRLPEAWHCFTPDGTRLVAAASDRVRVHDAATGKILSEVFLGEWPSRGVSVLPDNRHVVALTAQGNLHLGDTHTGKIRHTWPADESPAWTPDGRTLFVKAKGDKTYLAWDVQQDKPSTDFPARLDTLPETRPAPPLGLRCTDGKLRLWDNLQAKERAAFRLPDGEKVVPFGDPMALSIDSRYACVMTSFSVYLLRLPDVLPAKELP